MASDASAAGAAPSTPKLPLRTRLRNALAVFRQVPGTFKILWETSPAGTIAIALTSLVSALLPAAMAWVGKLIIDAVVRASASGLEVDRARVYRLVMTELALMAGTTVLTRIGRYLHEVIGAKLGAHLSGRIVEKALSLELRHFEDSAVYDKMQNARREAGYRPLTLVMEAFGILQNLVTLAAYAALVVSISPWSVLILIAASIPSFIGEVRFAGESFRINSWRAPEGRKLNYLEWVLTRDSHVKEVKLYGLGPLVLGRYRSLFSKFFDEDRRLALRRMSWGLLFGLISLAAFYGCYAWIAGRAARAEITLGDMTLYLVVFRQGQGAFQQILTAIGSMYEHSLFMSNLFAYLGIEAAGEAIRGTAAVAPEGRSNAIEMRNVSFKYAGKEEWAIRDVSLRIEPGEKIAFVGENGAGKTTLVKLLMRLYEPTEGEIFYGGVDIRDMDPADLRARIGVVFQDAVRYQFNVAENIGLGDVAHLENRPRIEKAASQGGAETMISELPKGYETVLGGWFEKGQELSGGQWQKIAISRAFMRDAEVLILDEPSASIDAESEHELFQRLKQLTAGRIAIVISHRFSTVRIADRIVVLHHGRIEELGSHEELVARGGRYAHLFDLQAKGYR